MPWIQALLREWSGCLVATSVLWAASVQAVPIGGVEFPQGAVSFADAVASYSPIMVGTGPTAPHRVPANALGVPDYNGVNGCGAVCSFVSLGDGGSLVVQFTDNALTGSGTAAADLWIFEVGPDVEDMFVDISVDGAVWHSVGSVGGATAGVNIDAFGHGVGTQFFFVRLTDDPNRDGQSGATVGADIDAVGAISTVRINRVTEPAPLGLSALALAALALCRLQRVKQSRIALQRR